jgi:hypothetical protein
VKIFFRWGIAGGESGCNFAIPFGFSGCARSKKGSSLTSYSQKEQGKRVRKSQELPSVAGSDAKRRKDLIQWRV